jgi:competence protein ComEC
MPTTSPAAPGTPSQHTLIRAGARARALSLFAALALGMITADTLDARSAAWSTACFLLSALGALLAGLLARLIGRPRAALPAGRSPLGPITPALLLLALSIAAFGAGWHAIRVWGFTQSPRSAAVALGAFDNSPPGITRIVTVRGVAETRPVMREALVGEVRLYVPDQAQTRCFIRINAVMLSDGTWLPVYGRATLAIRGSAPHWLVPGAGLHLTGNFEPVRRPTNPGQIDARPIASQMHDAGIITTSGPALIEPAPEESSSWLSFRGRLAARAHALLDRAAGDDPLAAALLHAMMLGELDSAGESIRATFTRQGLVHILCISGFHLTAMALVALAVVRLAGDRGWIEPAAISLLIILYASIIPAHSPIMRAVAMTLALVLARVGARRYDALTLLFWIACAVIIWRPRELWGLGFQLSFGLTAALLWLTATVEARLFAPRLRGLMLTTPQRIARSAEKLARGALAVNIICWSLSAPLIIARVGILSPLAIALSLLVTPLAILLLWIGFALLLAGVFIPALADIAGLALAPLAQVLVRIVQLADHVPLSAVVTPPVPVWWAALATTPILLALRTGIRHSPPLARIITTITAALSLAWLVWAGATAGRLPRGVDLRVDMIDVGNGSCFLIRSRHDAILWDCGGMPGTGVQTRAVRAIRTLGVWRVPTLVVTHPDTDHFAGAAQASTMLGFRTLVVPPRFMHEASRNPGAAAADFVRAMDRRGIPLEEIYAGDAPTLLPGISCRILSPPRDADWREDNEHSIVALFETAGGRTLLLTGDVQGAAINWLEATYPGLRANVMEAPHHGSAVPEAIRWVRTVDPAIVLQSSGARRLNDPRWAFLRDSRAWFNTAQHGAAWVEFDSDGGVRAGAFNAVP